MGLVLGIIVALGTLAAVLLIGFANGMSDAPSQQGISVWPTLLIGGAISAALIWSHYHHIHIPW